MYRYGYFDDARREYVITRPDTPLPWINYLGTDVFFGLISNTAGGYTCYRDARLRRLTRYRYNSVPADSGGRYIYLRDDDSGEYWSPSWQPTQRGLDSYECRHGLAYTQITSRYRGVRAEIRYFVPLDETLEVWRLRVSNERGVPVRVSVFSSVEFCLWDAYDDATNFQRNYSTGEVEVADGVIYHKTEYRERRHAWFRRAYDYFGNTVGSSENEEGSIFIEPQGICVMSGIGIDNGMAIRALDSVREHLATDHGIVLLQPAYTRYHAELGEISSYPPGYKENASVFCHTNPWLMIAEAMCGRGAEAFDYYKRINPSAREEMSEIHGCEPYVYAQMIAGKDAPTYGEAKNSWLTGAAAWNLVAITQWILGIRAEYDGLRIDPVLPSGWQGFSAVRRFRGATYKISVRNQGGGGRVSQLCVDGVPVAGTIVPVAAAGATVDVEAVITKTPHDGGGGS
jgi:cellobiose phosphorylase